MMLLSALAVLQRRRASSGGGGSPVSVSYIAKASNGAATAGATITFAGMSFGATDPSRRVFAVICHRSNNGTAPTVTIGGASATVHGHHSRNVSGTEFSVTIASVANSGDATGDVAVGTALGGTGTTWMTCYILRVLNASGTAHATAGLSGVAGTIDVPAGGALIAGHSGNAGTGSLTYTGVGNAQSTSEPSTDSSAAAYEAYASLQTGLAIQIDNGSDNGESALFVSLQSA